MKGYTERESGKWMKTRTITVHMFQETTLAVMEAADVGQVEAERLILEASMVNPVLSDTPLEMDTFGNLGCVGDDEERVELMPPLYTFSE